MGTDNPYVVESSDLDKKVTSTNNIDHESLVESSSIKLEFQDNNNNNHNHEVLNRGLSVRQISMLTIGGVIGSGLFFSGSSLSTGGPISLLVCYIIMGVSVYITMLSLGEMSSLIPTTGSFTTYASRFGSQSFGFAILTNYAFNDGISLASDLTGLQLTLEYWDFNHYWAGALVVWVVLLGFNFCSVNIYGEVEYWLALLKVVTILIFFIISIVVNCGVNDQNEYIGFRYWKREPTIGGFGGFARMFVSAAFALGGVESINLTAGETSNPTRNIPKTVKLVFFRIIIFYILTIFFIGINVPADYPGLSTKSVQTSPFTIVFQMIGAKAGGSFMNAVILTSLVSAGNHALYAGSRLTYTLGTEKFGPKFLTRLNRFNIPYVSVLIIWFIGGLAFAASFVGSGQLWTWLQSIIGVSNQLSWLTIAITSIRFRKGLKVQGLEHLLIYENWTYPWGPWANAIFIAFVVLIQGWTSFSPFDVSSFFQSYLELGVFPLTFIIWWLIKKGKDKFIKFEDMDFQTDRYYQTEKEIEQAEYEASLSGWAKFKYNIIENLF